MRKEYFRSKSADAQTEVKKAVIKLLKSKKKQCEIADLFSIRPQTVSKWWKIYQSEGMKGLHAKTRGRR